MASAGSGSIQHVAGELFKMMTGIKMHHVPYRGDVPAFAALMGGQVQAFFGALSGSIEQIRAGKLRGLAVTTPSRLPALPDVPRVWANSFQATKLVAGTELARQERYQLRSLKNSARRSTPV